MRIFVFIQTHSHHILKSPICNTTHVDHKNKKLESKLKQVSELQQDVSTTICLTAFLFRYV